MTDQTIVVEAPSELVTEPEAPATETDVEIARIEGETEITIAETHAAVEIARIEAGAEIERARIEGEPEWLSTLTARLDGLQDQMTNLSSSIQPLLATPSSQEIAETIVEEMTSLSTPQSTPIPTEETQTEVTDDVEAPANPAEVEHDLVEEMPEVVVGIKRKRVIV